MKERCGQDFLTVTPGIRFADSAVGDQKRIMTPEKAGKSGCDYIVMGRPITPGGGPGGRLPQSRPGLPGLKKAPWNC